MDYLLEGVVGLDDLTIAAETEPHVGRAPGDRRLT